MTLRVAIQQRLRLLREGTASLLAAEGDMAVVSSVVRGDELVPIAENEAPDVVVMEVDARDWDSCRMAQAVHVASRQTRLVGTYWDDGEEVEWARTCGFRWLASYHTGSRRALIDVVRTAVASPITPIRVRQRTRAPLGQLTKREIQILQFIGTGCTAREISDRMSITYKTVENHKQRIFCKLGVQNQAHAVSVAFRRGFLEPVTVVDEPGRRGLEETDHRVASRSRLLIDELDGARNRG